MTNTNRTAAPALKTRTIAGVRITLATGCRYVATRPFAERGRRIYPVTIQPAFGAPIDAQGVTIDGLNLAEATRLINRFNNGEHWTDGRAW